VEGSGFGVIRAIILVFVGTDENSDKSKIVGPRSEIRTRDLMRGRQDDDW
jgi:hypothetical protein